MAELVPAPFPDLVTRLYAESQTNDSVFALPRKKWYVPDPSEPDLSVKFHRQVAGNASGPAAGPQTQMAQNLLLSYAAGGRILELKTVQINDRLQIPRPCIDVTNIGYNVEWSQELLVEQSLREYVAGMMLIEIFRNDRAFLPADPGEVIYDLSVGYDLEGIKSEKVQKFLDGMRDAKSEISNLKSQIPAQYKLARDLDYPAKLSETLTLSTFHGCPANEIERICEFLLGERDLDVIVKMNPPMLGKERLEYLLHEVLGYRDLTVNPAAYTSGLQYDEGVQLVDRLKRFAAARGRSFGCKFSNTLEVLNHREFFTKDNKVQYLSGQPLHVITMTLTDVFRQDVGADIPISFSAGIDNKNFPLAVACGFVPATVCTDLLRPGGYGRLPAYMKSLASEMTKVGAKTIDEYILKAFGQGEAGGNVNAAAMKNTTIVAEKARNDPRYRYEANKKSPTRINSILVTFDCITCDKCVPVCPNAANFTYPAPKVAFDYRDILVAGDGTVSETGDVRHFEIDQEHQIANYADFCNECGNCDTFCPEYGGPYIKKPGFYSSLTTWEAARPRDGFVVNGSTIVGRIKGVEYELVHDPSNGYRFSCNGAVVTLSADHVVRAAKSSNGETLVDMGVYHTLRHLLHGILDMQSVNQINVASA
jgi:putative selenate reductase